eukprot:Tbor_TRINITY_DN9928_c0_g1::TRINITY_DN9928_c0_g1_i1::g.17615::m.17615
MTKRMRENGEGVTLDPAVEQVMESYEASLAAFMSSLSPLITRYNELLQAALPHNPKASFYTVCDNEDAEEENSTSKTGGSSVAKVDDKSDISSVNGNRTPEKKKHVTGEVATMTATQESTTPKKRPTSPLLRRPQVNPEVMEELNRTASRIMTGDTNSKLTVFPIHTNICNKDTSVHLTGVPASSSEIARTNTASEPEGIKTKANRDLSVVKNSLGNKTKTIQQPKKDAKTVQQLLEEVECSPLILAQLHLLRKEAEELLSTFDRIHDWIAMKVPAMKEGDNIVVSVMAAVIGEISSISSAITQNVSYFGQQFISERGKLEVEYLLNPGSETIKSLIASHDATKWDDVEAGWRLLMRAVIIIHSRLAKNMKTLKTPQEKRINMSL